MAIAKKQNSKDLWTGAIFRHTMESDCNPDIVHEAIVDAYDFGERDGCKTGILIGGIAGTIGACLGIVANAVIEAIKE